MALLDAFRGHLGGPLAELAGVVGEERGFSQVPIEYRLVDGYVSVSVPDRLKIVAHLDPPGVPGDRGRAVEMSVDVPEHGLSWRGHDAPAVYREFRCSCTSRRGSP